MLDNYIRFNEIRSERKFLERGDRKRTTLLSYMERPRREEETPDVHDVAAPSVTTAFVPGRELRHRSVINNIAAALTWPIDISSPVARLRCNPAVNLPSAGGKKSGRGWRTADPSSCLANIKIHGARRCAGRQICNIHRRYVSLPKRGACTLLP